MFEETIRDLLVTGLADGVLFGVHLELEELHPKDSLLHIPDDVFESEPDNTGDAIQALQRGVTGLIDQSTTTHCPLPLRILSLSRHLNP